MTEPLDIAPNPARSALMRRVRQERTSAEDAVARSLRAAGIAYRRNVRSLPGSPDFANKSRRWALFVQGCFWHHHTNCKRATIPKSNCRFWSEKFAANRRRDAAKVRQLRRAGYRVLLIWECRIAAVDVADRLLRLTRGTRK